MNYTNFGNGFALCVLLCMVGHAIFQPWLLYVGVALILLIVLIVAISIFAHVKVGSKTFWRTMRFYDLCIVLSLIYAWYLVIANGEAVAVWEIWLYRGCLVFMTLSCARGFLRSPKMGDLNEHTSADLIAAAEELNKNQKVTF